MLIVGFTVNVTVPSAAVVVSAGWPAQPYGIIVARTSASRTAWPFVSVTQTVSVNGERVVSRPGWNWTREMTRRSGSETLVTGTEMRPSARVVAPDIELGAATIAVGALVAVVDPLAFVATTMPRIVLPTSAVASVIAVVVMTVEASAQLLPTLSQRRH